MKQIPSTSLHHLTGRFSRYTGVRNRTTRTYSDQAEEAQARTTWVVELGWREIYTWASRSRRRDLFEEQTGPFSQPKELDLAEV